MQLLAIIKLRLIYEEVSAYYGAMIYTLRKTMLYIFILFSLNSFFEELCCGFEFNGNIKGDKNSDLLFNPSIHHFGSISFITSNL